MKVVQKNLEGGEIRLFNSVTHASKQLKIKRDLILKCCRDKQKTVKGSIFNYENQK